MTIAARIQSAVRRHGTGSYGQRQRISDRKAIPAPVKGWNARDALAAMNDDFAVSLVNFFPEAGRVRLRRGYTTFAAGLGGDVESLFPHSSGTTRKLIGAANGNLWDVDVGDPRTPVSIGSGYASNRWQAATFGGHTIAVNGADDPIRVMPDGTLAAAHGWTGNMTPANLVHVMPFKNRLFFVEKDSAKLWYGPVAGVQGELVDFDLSLVVPRGGNVIAIGNLTLDSGLGVDDLFCAFYESGEVSVYQGTDIADSERFAEVGVFDIGPLIGRRALVKLGGDLIAITNDGYVPVRRLLQTGREGDRLALSDRISSAVTEAARIYANNFGWQAVLHTPANWLMFNIPAGSGTEQHVMNTQTGAWCKFTGMPAHCWGRFDDRLFWGGDDGMVYEADVGAVDGTANIDGEVQTAYSYLKTASAKDFNMIRPLIESTGEIDYELGTSVDFQQATVLDADGAIVSDVATFSDATWDTFRWGGAPVLSLEWRSVTASGSALSIRLKTSTRGRACVAVRDRRDVPETHRPRELRR